MHIDLNGFWLPLLDLNQRLPVITQLTPRCSVSCASLPSPQAPRDKHCGQPPFGLLPLNLRSHWSNSKERNKKKGTAVGRTLLFELVGQNCNSVKSRILCLRFINIEIIPLNTVLVNRFLKSFCKIIETMSYYFLYLMYKYRLKRGKPILSLSFLCCFYFSQFFFGLITAFESYDDLLVSADLDTLN